MRTGYRAELRADIELRLAGFTLFAPTVWKPATLPRRDRNGVVRPGQPDRIVPLFPRYLFVRFRRVDPEWRQIRGFEGVDYIFSTTPDRPVAVPDPVIAAIQARCEVNGCLYPANVNLHDLAAAPPIDAGAEVRLLSGPMAELSGICQMSDAKRVRVLLAILGRPVLVTVARAAVEAV